MELKMGTLLTLEPTFMERVEKFRCRIVEQADNIIFIDYPINTKTKKTAFLVDGSQFRVTFMNEDKQSYAFNTEVLGRKGGIVPMVMLSCPPTDEFIKIQRREYVRVETSIDVAVECNGKFYQFTSDDISAGGLSVILKNPVVLKDGDEVQLTVVLPYSNGDLKYVQTTGIVMRLFDRDTVKIASIQFIATDDIDKQHIVRYCFERQLQQRKKELNES